MEKSECIKGRTNPLGSRMKLAVVIPTYGRKQLLSRLLSHLEHQSRLPDIVVISAPDSTHIGSTSWPRFKAVCIFGKQGLSSQRNQALERVLPDYDIVVFFDDDFVPASDYLLRVEEAFETHPDWSVLTGHVVSDGVCGPGLSFEEGLKALHEDSSKPMRQPMQIQEFGAYGCNMALRLAHVGDLRFDERLPLYGWLEDVDFTSQFRRHGRVIRLNTLRGVHLGFKAGRVSGVRFGYSQIINPVYLIQKGTVPLARGLRLMTRNVLANIARSLWPEPYVDRRGRLKGNLLGAYHLVRRKVEPEHILTL